MTLPLNWPGSLDSFAMVAPTQETDDPGFELDLMVNRINTLLMALETKLGTGSSTPAANQVLRSTAAGAATYGTVATPMLAANAVSTVQEATLIAGAVAAGTTNQIWSGSQINYANSQSHAVGELLVATFAATLYWSGGATAASYANWQVWEGTGPGTGLGGTTWSNWPGHNGFYTVSLAHVLGPKTADNPYFMAVTVSGVGSVNLQSGLFQLWTLKK